MDCYAQWCAARIGIGAVAISDIRMTTADMATQPINLKYTYKYSPFIVTMAVSLTISEIISVKEWPGLEISVRGRSRSLKMAPFDRPCMTFY